MTPEGLVENAIFDFLKLLGVFVFKHDSVGIYDPVKKTYRQSRNRNRVNGVSDILGLIDGRFLAIEVKSAKGRLTPEQKAFISMINAHGGIAFVARSVDEVALQLSTHFQQHEEFKI